MDISSGGQKLDTSSQALGWLRDSSSALSDVQELRWRMDEDGYLYLPGFLNRKNVQEVRSQICQILAKEGLLDPARPPIDAMAKPGLKPRRYCKSSPGQTAFGFFDLRSGTHELL